MHVLVRHVSLFKTFMYFEVLAYVFPALFLIYRPPWSLWLFRLDRRVRLDLITVLFAGVSVPILYPVYSLYTLDRLCLSRNLPTRTLAQTTLTRGAYNVV